MARGAAPRGPRTGLERGVVAALVVVALVALAVLVAGSGSGDEPGPPAGVPAAAAAPDPGTRLVQLSGRDACLKGRASPRWTRCSVQARGLQDARSLAISPDGRFAYAASVEGSSVAALRRDPRTGALRSLPGRAGCLADPSAASASRCTRVAGLRGALTVTLAPDGRHAYVAAIDSSAVVALAVDPRTGALRPLRGATGCVTDVGTPAGACARTDGLAGARWVEVSPDGRNVYVAAPASDALVVLRRDRTTGGLTPLAGAGCVRDDRAPTPCPLAVTGLDEPRMVTVSPDGRNVYAVGEHSYTVVAFTRAREDGALTPVEGAPCVEDEQAPAPVACPATTRGLNFAFFVAVSPDGRHVYATATASDAVVTFDRDPGTGALRPVRCVKDVHAPGEPCERRTRGLDGAAALRLSRDGRSAYVASFYGGAVAVLRRDPASGSLTPLGCLMDPGAPSTPQTTRCPGRARGLEGPRDVVLSPDGRNAYVPASVGGSIAVFRRGR